MTNFYTPSTIQEQLYGMLGWRPSQDPYFPTLESTLTASTSGLYYNDYNPLLKYENIQAVLPNFDAYSVDAWVITTAYAVGDIVKDGNFVYKCKTINTGKQPSSNFALWKLLICDYLENITKHAIYKSIRQVIDKKISQSNAKTLIEQLRIFEGEGRIADTVINQSRFVGLRFTLKRYSDLKLILNYVGLQFTQIQTDLTLYLFHSSQLDAVATTTITTTKASSMEWTALAWDLEYLNFTKNDAGGSFYVGYFEADITSGQAIKHDFDFNRTPCANCNNTTNYNYYAYNLYNNYVDIEPIFVEQEDLNGIQLWDVNDTGIDMSNSFGLNFDLSMTCDITQSIVKNKELFYELIGKQVAVDLLREMAYSTRSNEVVNKIVPLALYELKGDGGKPFPSGAEYELNKIVDSIDFDLSQLNSPCFRSNNRRLKSGAI